MTIPVHGWIDECLAGRAADPSYTFRKHLRQSGRAIEE
jgi:hypothetical protein